MYWTLYLIDKEYVVNDASGDRYPWWLTHAGHSMVVPILLLEALTTYHRRSRLVIEMSILIALVGSYVLWIYYLGLVQHIWVYGILRKISTVNRVVILCGFGVYAIVLYLIGLLLHKILWPQRRQEVWPQQWSADEISNGQLEFENFRVRQGLIR
ncbi:unnamed protein product [Oppiella nova]|uniref:Uncharacterized protein n=1 Tax=Oppiella nova TaxID=334625 RepID=A0A7R9LWT1_9ACAR|nr:unnamed protein product [Oppiella nova]CAG2167779.1 unnamed protein product [Oppiella nova]